MKKYIINIALSIFTFSAYSYEYLNTNDKYSPVTDDLSNKMDAVYTSMHHDIKSDNNLSLKDIGKQTRIRFLVEPEEAYSWGEDNKIVMRDGKTLYLLIQPEHFSVNYDEKSSVSYALGKASNVQIGGYHMFPSFHDELSGFNYMQGMSYDEIEVDSIKVLARSIERDMARIDNVKIRHIFPIVDGGNLLFGKRKNGEPYALIGQDALWATIVRYFGYDLQKNTDVFKGLSAGFDLYLDKTEFQKNFEKQYTKYTEWLKRNDNNNHNGIFNRESLLASTVPLSSYESGNMAEPDRDYMNTFEDIRTVSRVLLEFNSYDYPALMNAVTTKRVLSWLARMEMTKEMIAKTFHIKTKDLIPFPQNDFHIDVGVRPYGNQQVILDEPAETLKLLKTAFQESCKDAIPIYTSFCHARSQTISEARRHFKNRQAIYEAQKKVLEDNGLQAIPSPGAFNLYIQGRYKPSQGNFMNGIISTVSQGSLKNQSFYMVLGSAYEEINEAYRSWFADTFKGNPDLKLFLMGTKRPKNDVDSDSVSESLTQNYGGFDCMTVHF